MATPIKPSEVWSREDDAAVNAKLEELYSGLHPSSGGSGFVWGTPGHNGSGTRIAPSITDHAEASAVMLEGYAARIRGGASPEDLGKDVELLGRVMARRT